MEGLSSESRDGEPRSTKRIAYYKLLSKPGTFYRGTDTKRNRDIAIKVLPAPFAY